MDIHRIIKSEFKSKFTLGAVMLMVVATIFPLLSLIFRPAFEDTQGHDYIVWESWTRLNAALGQGVTYLTIFRVFQTLRDKSTLDKNRASYLAFNKHKVLFAKLLADIALYLISIVALVFFSWIIIKFKMNGIFSSGFAEQIVVYLVGMFFMYLAITYGMRLFQSYIKDKIKSALAIASWILLIAGTWIVMSILPFFVDSVMTNVMDNKWLWTFMPFLNVTTIPMVLNGFYEMWAIVPLCVYSIIFIGATWKPMSAALKEFLCA